MKEVKLRTQLDQINTKLGQNDSPLKSFWEKRPRYKGIYERFVKTDLKDKAEKIWKLKREE